MESELTGAKVLLVDDTPDNLKVLRQTLESEGYSILVATNGESGLKIATSAQPDLILLDVMMPGMDGFETCRRLKQTSTTADIPVIFITGRNETEDIIEGFRTGGVDYIVKPFRSEEVLIRAETHLKIDRLSRELARKNKELCQTNSKLTEEIARRQALSVERNHMADQLSMISDREAERYSFVGNSETIRTTLAEIGRLKNTATTVLVTGESGTGKELVARAIHHGSPRRSGPFVPVNCSAIPAELAESMLFGHIRGSFTGADRDRAGYFELAHGGTLFLDEIGDMPADIQSKLLRVLEDGLVRPVGATKEKQIDVRILAATNADLQGAVEAGTFRQDLYFRLARFLVEIPPLRERTEDVPVLSQHFLKMFATEMAMEPPKLSTDAVASLAGYDFPGNVRELKNIIERAVIESGGAAIQRQHLHFLTSRRRASSTEQERTEEVDSLPINLKQAETLLIERALEQTGGNIAAAARLLGTNRPRIYRFIEENRAPASGKVNLEN